MSESAKTGSGDPPRPPDGMVPGVPSAVRTDNTQLEIEQRLGRVLGKKYRLDALVGVGGMGAVYRAHHLLLKRDVAVKVLHRDLTSNEQVTRRFDREAQSAARLDHPNINGVTDYGSTEDGMKFMVMPLLEGHELVHELQGEPLSEARALELVVQIFRALEHAHAHGVIHRDLKPENIFLTTDHDGHEVLKIVDFGIAKMASQGSDPTDEPLTRLGLVFGTPMYMSPEQATGISIDARTDLYSAGVMLYEMLGGAPPFRSDDPIALTRMQVSRDADPLPRSVSPVLARVVYRLLSKDRDQRYASAKEARMVLEDVREMLVSGIRDLRELEAMAEGGSDEPSGSHTGELYASLHHSGDETDPDPPAHPESAATLPAVVDPRAAVTEPPRRAMWPFIVGGAALVAIPIAAVLGVLYGNPGAWTQGPKDNNDADLVIDEGPAVPTPTSSQMAEIDKRLLAKDAKGALERILPLRVVFVDDPQLLWREGKALALDRKTAGAALEVYAEALERDDSLIADHEFYVELYDLMTRRALRSEAIEIAVERLGTRGHKFLLELVNEQVPKRALRYEERHRVLEALEGDPESKALINHPLNVARDLWQAPQADKPCAAFAVALDEIQASPDPFYVVPLQKANLPEPAEGDAGDAAVCATLPPRLDALRDALHAQFEENKAGEHETAEEAGEAPVPKSPPSTQPKKQKKATSKKKRKGATKK